MSARFNAIKIQMLSSALHKHVFGNEFQAKPQAVKRSIEHLTAQGLWGKETPVLPDVDLRLPPLHGNNIERHFQHLGEQYCQPYKKLLHRLIKLPLPAKPKKWKFTPGWTRYEGSETYPVPNPQEEGIVLDVEVCQKDPNCPTLATAGSDKYWYSWCSERLVSQNTLDTSWRGVGMSDLIPLEPVGSHATSTERLVVGHNVSYDRAFIKEQYLLSNSSLRFLDTMSMHMCVSGLTGVQRLMSLAYKSSLTKKLASSDFETATLGWLDVSSLNNLADVYSLYCSDEKPVSKELRNIFISGSIGDVRDNFQALMTYCSDDVTATHEILTKIMPTFYERFPHPVTLAGMLEMSLAYLPVNEQWQRYLRDSQETYEDLQEELKLMLGSLAQDACALINDNRYHEDPWLWNLDWSVQKIKVKKAKSKKVQIPEVHTPEQSRTYLDEKEALNPIVTSVLATSDKLYKIRPHMPGYPAWYRDLCVKLRDLDEDSNISGPSKISTQVRQIPKLMRLMWEGNPLHYVREHGWGYLVPVSKKVYSYSNEEESTTLVSFPLQSLLKLQSSEHPTTEMLQAADEDDMEALLEHSLSSASRFSHNEISSWTGDKNLDQDGPDKKVGNPLAKDFLRRVSEGTLRAGVGEAQRALTLSNMASYWKNTHKRIQSQMVVWLDGSDIPSEITSHPDFDEKCLYGAILPRLIVSGTVTRRAVEPTWLTASNAYADRVGSELKAMVHSPPGYYFVGADVDAQELWIASVLGDAYFAGLHGSTAFGWMTLQGDKASRTDLHSKTADTISISRDQAKVLNYGRIYGAGQAFATQLLMQFNKELSLDEAKEKARTMYSQTKGIRKNPPKSDVDEDVEVIIHTKGNAFKKKMWSGGSESPMFNCLEAIALSETPTTPVLGCRISRALEPSSVERNFLTSRVNWVVQSSAVDYLHLMLVSMHWLMKSHGVKGRFSLSIHDEVRYLVPAADRYQAALCLQITNLLVRSLFASKMGMADLPQSVAFFSAVDIDVCLRKEVHLDCQTPSCPRGLHKGYNIPPGESLDIHQLIKITGNSLKKRSPNNEVNKILKHSHLKV